jgi:protein TonB
MAAAPPTVAPTPHPAVASVLPFGPDMSRPVLLSGSEPAYTREAALAKVEGTVIARCTITVAGTLESCRILKGLPFMDRSMLDALATRRYTPVVYQGHPVAVEYVFNVKLVAPR